MLILRGRQRHTHRGRDPASYRKSEIERIRDRHTEKGL